MPKLIIIEIKKYGIIPTPSGKVPVVFLRRLKKHLYPFHVSAFRVSPHYENYLINKLNINMKQE